jgi:hypothetical protein
MLVENSGYDIYKSGYSLEFDLDLEWPPTPALSRLDLELRAARDAVAAVVEVFRGWVVPLEFGVALSLIEDVEGLWLMEQFTDRYWYLNVSGREPEPLYGEPIVVEAATIDGPTMMALVDEVFMAPSEQSEGRWLGWSRIHVSNTLARLPDALVPVNGDWFVVDDLDNRNRDLRIPLRRRDGGAWVGRYELGFWPPVAVSVTRDPIACGFSDAEGHYTTIHLSVTVHWSVWWRQGSPGRATLDAAVQRLHVLGWYEIHS